MPDLQNFSRAEGAAVQVTVPDTVIQAQVYDDSNNLVADYTGPAALHFPAVLAALTPLQRDAILSNIAQTLVLNAAGY